MNKVYKQVEELAEMIELGGGAIHMDAKLEEHEQSKSSRLPMTVRDAMLLRLGYISYAMIGLMELLGISEKELDDAISSVLSGGGSRDS
jgi:hypothetical protein